MKPLRRTLSIMAVAAATLIATTTNAQPNNGNGNGNGKGPASSVTKEKGPKELKSNGHMRGNQTGNAKTYSSNPGKGNNGPGGAAAAGRAGNYANSGSGASLSVEFRFNDSQRSYLRNYYHNEFSRGNCPPGLAKKNNGCMPPGQAKKWRIGQPLGRDVIFYDLPAAVLAELGPAPRGYRYARVADDILMLAVGTGLVVDAIASLSQ